MLKSDASKTTLPEKDHALPLGLLSPELNSTSFSLWWHWWDLILGQWSRTSGLEHGIITHQLFSRERFLTIFQTMLHTGQPETESKANIEPFVDSLCKRFNKVFSPFRQLSIDEMVVGYKGRWQYKQFNASKPEKYHIKSFGLVDSTCGYVLQILTYFGANTSYHPDCDPDSGMAIRIFDTLLKDLGTGYHIYADRWYTTRALVDHLTAKNLYYTGTLQTNRKLPPELKTRKLQHMDSKFYKTTDKKLLCLSFKDKKAKKPVHMVSNNSTVETVQVRGKTKPTMVHEYNQFMNGCDRADQNFGYYGLHTRKSKKWWKKIYFWALEIVHINAFTLYKIQNNPTPQQLRSSKFSLKTFKEPVLKGLVEMYAQEAGLTNNLLAQPEPGRVLPGRPDPLPLERVSAKQHLIRHTKNDTKCQ